MSRHIINISLPPFIAAWLKHDASSYPIYFSRNTVEYLIMEQFSVSDPATVVEQGIKDDNSLVAVVVPEFRYKDSSYHYLPQAGKKALEQCIKDRFAIDLWKGLHKFGHIGKERKYIILAWMEAHGIPDEGSNWDAIEKRYQRQRDRYLSASRKKKQRKSINK